MIQEDENEAFDEIRAGMATGDMGLTDESAVDLIHTRLLEARAMCIRYEALCKFAYAELPAGVMAKLGTRLYKSIIDDMGIIQPIREATQLTVVDHVLRGGVSRTETDKLMDIAEAAAGIREFPKSHDVSPKLRRYDKLIKAVDEFCETGEYNDLHRMASDKGFKKDLADAKGE